MEVITSLGIEQCANLTKPKKCGLEKTLKSVHDLNFCAIKLLHLSVPLFA